MMLDQRPQARRVTRALSRPRKAPSDPARRRTEATAPVRRYFEQRALAFDRLYEPRATTRLLRSGPSRGRDLAAAFVSRSPGASVLDVGCGPGRVAEAVMEVGAGTYVGVDFAPRMLELARARLERFDSVDLLEADFLDLDLGRTFDVVLALGLFDYLAEPASAARWLRAHCSSILLASFARWDWVKGPIRHAHYELLHRCRIFDYREEPTVALFARAGFSRIDVYSRSRRGFVISASAPAASILPPQAHGGSDARRARTAAAA